jgi:hypothetical protein
MGIDGYPVMDGGIPAPDASELQAHGYAPGEYTMRCGTCQQHAWGLAKLATRCQPCATESYKQAVVSYRLANDIPVRII